MLKQSIGSDRILHKKRKRNEHKTKLKVDLFFL